MIKQKKYINQKKDLDELEKEVQAEVQKMIRENVDAIVNAYEEGVNEVLDDLEEGEWTDLDAINEYVFAYYFS